jgi:tRNA nucleotidyltransferase/poly(A) polymerase
MFTCTCEYMSFAGIICHHVLRVATQLNLDSFSKKMYLSRWCKNPTEMEMMHQYKTFYTLQPHVNTFSENITQLELEQDHIYNLNRTIWRVQRFVNQKPETAQIFNESLSILLKAQITATSNEYNANKNGEVNNIIRNPQNVKAKGGVRSNKRKSQVWKLAFKKQN